MSNWLKNLSFEVTKEDLKTFKSTQDIPEIDIEHFVNLWLTEGIPFAFRDKPYIYQLIRYRLSQKLDIHAKDISLVGSARTGFSFYKLDQNGDLQDFSITQCSDLDLFIVSKDYFDKINDEIKDWIESKKNCQVNTIKHQIKHGFLDTWNIPNDYAETQKINSSVTNLNKWLHMKNHPVIQKNKKWAGIRIYKDWRSVIKQNILNLKNLGHKTPKCQ